MTKVVYNRCYGGFGLSDEAMLLYCEKKGIKVYPCDEFGHTTFYTDENKSDYIYDRELERDDPVLIEVVEELGDKANGECAELAIEYISKGTPYRIREYDGFETFEYANDVDWKVG